MYAIFRDSKRLDPLTEYFTEAEAFGGLHRVQPHSVDHATKHEGYSIRSIPGQAHVRKYASICKLWGVRIPDSVESWGGKPRAWWREQAQKDWALNCFGLRFWDQRSAHLWAKAHTYNIDGIDDGHRRGASKAEALCATKHAVRDWALRGEE